MDVSHVLYKGVVIGDAVKRRFCLILKSDKVILFIDCSLKPTWPFPVFVFFQFLCYLARVSKTPLKAISSLAVIWRSLYPSSQTVQIAFRCSSVRLYLLAFCHFQKKNYGKSSSRIQIMLMLQCLSASKWDPKKLKTPNTTNRNRSMYKRKHPKD